MREDKICGQKAERPALYGTDYTKVSLIHGKNPIGAEALGYGNQEASDKPKSRS